MSKEAAEFFTQTFQNIVQKRENIGILWENLRLSNLGRSFEVMDLASQLGRYNSTKPTNKDIAAIYNKTKYAKSSEPVTKMSCLLHQYETPHSNCIRSRRMHVHVEFVLSLPTKATRMLHPSDVSYLGVIKNAPGPILPKSAPGGTSDVVPPFL